MEGDELKEAWLNFLSRENPGPDIILATDKYLHMFYCELMREHKITFYEGVRRLFNLGFRGPALTGLNWRISLAKD